MLKKVVFITYTLYIKGFSTFHQILKCSYLLIEKTAYFNRFNGISQEF